MRPCACAAQATAPGTPDPARPAGPLSRPPLRSRSTGGHVPVVPTARSALQALRLLTVQPSTRAVSSPPGGAELPGEGQGVLCDPGPRCGEVSASPLCSLSGLQGQRGPRAFLQEAGVGYQRLGAGNPAGRGPTCQPGHQQIRGGFESCGWASGDTCGMSVRYRRPQRWFPPGPAAPVGADVCPPPPLTPPGHVCGLG